MASFDEWRDAIMPVLPGATETSAKAAFLFAAQNFYKRTRAWRVDTGFLPVTEDEPLVTLPETDAYRPVMVEEAYFDGSPLLLRHKPFIFPSDAPGKPLRAWMPDPLTLSLWPVPDADYPDMLKCSMSAYPKTVDSLPDFAPTHHFEGLESGALARLYAMPKTPHSDPKLADFHHRKFTAEVVRAKARVSHGNAGLHGVWSYGVVPPR